MFNYFSNCSLAFVVLHADALARDKDSIVWVTPLNEYTLICRWRCTRLVHCIVYPL